MKRRPLYLTLLCAALLPAAAFTMGGWAAVTVDDLPEYFVAGKPTDISFAVRQHGITLLSNLEPKVSIASGSQYLMATVKPQGTVGHYTATFTPPATGQWTVRIRSGFGNSENTLLPIEAINAKAQPPRALAAAELGHRLFIAKACTSCHVRGDEGVNGLKYAPILTGRSFPPEPLAKFLDHPAANRLSAMPSQERMPKLDLKQQEIAALVAFLNSDAKQLGARK